MRTLQSVCLVFGVGSASVTIFAIACTFAAGLVSAVAVFTFVRMKILGYPAV